MHPFMRMIVLLVLTLIWCCAQARAQEVFSDDFEIGNTSLWQEQVTNGTATASVVHAPAHSGRNAFAATASRDGGLNVALLGAEMASVPNPVYVRVSFYIGPGYLIAPGDSNQLLALVNFSNYVRYAVELKRIGEGFVLHSPLTGDGRRSVSKARWHTLEMKYATGIGGGVTLYLDGNVDTGAKDDGVRPMNGIEIGLMSGYGNGGTIYYDDVLIDSRRHSPTPAHITVRHGGTFARTAMKLDVAMWGQSPSDQLTASLAGKEVFRTNHALSAREFATIPLVDLSPGTYSLDTSLVDANGTRKAATSETIRKYGPLGIPAVAIDANNNILRLGKKVFPIVPFVENTDAAREFLEKRYVNLNGWNSGWSESYTPEQYKAYIAKVGAPTIGPNSRFAGFQRGRGNEKDAIARYTRLLSNDPNLFGWTWCDEPDLGNPPDIAAAVVSGWTDVSHENDPGHPVFLNLYGYYPSNSRKNGYVYPNLIADIYSFDIYPVLSQGAKEQCHGLLSQNAVFGGCRVSMTQFVDAIDTWMSYNYDLTPWMTFVEFGDNVYGDPSNPSRAPTVAELRMELWLAVIHGTKGISWWPPTIGWGRIPTENLREARRFVSTVGDLSDVILADPTYRTVTSDQRSAGSRVDATLRETRGDLWVLAQRLTEFGEANAAELDTRLTISDFRGPATAEIYGENRTVLVVDGAFADKFAPYATHIYHIRH